MKQVIRELEQRMPLYDITNISLQAPGQEEEQPEYNIRMQVYSIRS
jgi:hypothetical protein